MQNKSNALVLALAVIGSLVLINILGLNVFGRVDLTQNKIFTLSQASKDTMKSLEEPVTITAYFTENLPPPYAGNARYVRDLLEEYRAASKGKLGYEFIDPATQETAEDKEKKKEVKRDIFGRAVREQTSVEKELTQTGVQPVEIRVVEEDQAQTKRAYMGLVIKFQEKKEVIPVVQDTSTLEYDLTSLVRKMTRTKMPVIAVLQGHEEPSFQENLTRLHTMFSETYQVRPLDLGSKDKVDDDVDALMVLGPKTALKANEVKAIDQFLMKGKSVAFFLDTVRVDLKTFQPTPVEHGLTSLLQTYGISLGDQLVADAQSLQLNVQERRGFMVVSMPVPYPFIPQVLKLEGDSAITAGLAGLAFPFISPITIEAQPNTEAVVLAKSSKKSWLENKPHNTDPRRDWRSETITPTGPYNLMVQVSGKFKSHYASEAAMSTGGATPLLAESQGDARIIVAGGSTMTWDEFMGRPNQALMLNVADWLLLDSALLHMRTRGLAESPIDPEVSDAKRNTVKFGNTLGVPLLLVLFGVGRWRMRESKRRAMMTPTA